MVHHSQPVVVENAAAGQSVLANHTHTKLMMVEVDAVGHLNMQTGHEARVPVKTLLSSSNTGEELSDGGQNLKLHLEPNIPKDRTPCTWSNPCTRQLISRAFEQCQGNFESSWHPLGCDEPPYDTVPETVERLGELADRVYVLFVKCDELRRLSWPAQNRTLYLRAPGFDKCMGTEDLGHNEKVTVAHWAVMEHAKRAGLSSVLVLEADATFEVASWREEAFINFKERWDAGTWDVARWSWRFRRFGAIRSGGRPVQGSLVKETQADGQCYEECLCEEDSGGGPWCTMGSLSCVSHSSAAYLIAGTAFAKFQAGMTFDKGGAGCGKPRQMCAVDLCPLSKLSSVYLTPPIVYDLKWRLDEQTDEFHSAQGDAEDPTSYFMAHCVVPDASMATNNNFCWPNEPSEDGHLRAQQTGVAVNFGF